MTTHSEITASRILAAASAVAALILAAACASIGNPSGGPRDEQPPRFLHSDPAPGSTDVPQNISKIRLTFDELVNVKDAFNNVVISPPSASVPRVTSLGKHINVAFTDSLLPNTTYTIDFGKSIEDNNEENPLENFSYSFSTGPTIDTLRIAGIVADAHTLEPLQRKLVGVHSDLSDTAIFRTRFDRVARTDDRGRFSIEGLAPGSYRVYALDDIDNDGKYSSPDEAVAVYNTIVSPSTDTAETLDSIYDFKKSRLDTVVTRLRTIFLPNDVLLRSFLTSRRQQFISKYERLDSTRLSIIFNAPQPLPDIRFVGAPNLMKHTTLERSAGNDTLTLWLNNPILVATDTLRLALKYQHLDSLNRYESISDTLRFVTQRPRAPKAAKKKKKAEEADTVAPPTPLLQIKWVSSNPHDVYAPVIFEAPEPVARIDTTLLRLEVKRDTIWTPVSPLISDRNPLAADGTLPVLAADTLNPRRYSISYPWTCDTQYRILADSTAIQGIYGLHTGPISNEVSIRKEKEYSTLTLRLADWPADIPAVVELLNASDTPVRIVPVVNGAVTFRWLKADKYYARVFADRNADGIWTSGDLTAGTPPEEAFYYPKAIKIKQHWNKDETWHVFQTPVDLQKPREILKNKPESRKNRPDTSSKPEEEEDEE